MAVNSMADVAPYAANFSIVMVMLALLLKKPARRFLYQRHERMKDAFESAEIAHKKALARAQEAKRAIDGSQIEEKNLLERERKQAELESKEILDKGEAEAKQVILEAERLAQVEQEEASDKVKEEFLRLVVKETEENLKRGLKRDDHTAILKRAQNSIEVGV